MATSYRDLRAQYAQQRALRQVPPKVGGQRYDLYQARTAMEDPVPLVPQSPTSPRYPIPLPPPPQWPGASAGIGRQLYPGNHGDAALKAHGWPSTNITARLIPAYVAWSRAIQRSTRVFASKYNNSTSAFRYIPGVFTPTSTKSFTPRGGVGV